MEKKEIKSPTVRLIEEMKEAIRNGKSGLSVGESSNKAVLGEPKARTAEDVMDYIEGTLSKEKDKIREQIKDIKQTGLRP